MAVAALVGALLGNLAGMRFHRKIDEASFDPRRRCPGALTSRYLQPGRPAFAGRPSCSVWQGSSVGQAGSGAARRVGFRRSDRYLNVPVLR